MLRIFITELVKNYPNEEKYALVDNMKRAVQSTTHNMAEGLAGFTTKKLFNFAD